MLIKGCRAHLQEIILKLLVSWTREVKRIYYLKYRPVKYFSLKMVLLVVDRSRNDSGLQKNPLKTSFFLFLDYLCGYLGLRNFVSGTHCIDPKLCGAQIEGSKLCRANLPSIFASQSFEPIMQF